MMPVMRFGQAAVVELQQIMAVLFIPNLATLSSRFFKNNFLRVLLCNRNAFG
jgi:hypothetical protein